MICQELQTANGKMLASYSSGACQRTTLRILFSSIPTLVYLAAMELPAPTLNPLLGKTRGFPGLSRRRWITTTFQLDEVRIMMVKQSTNDDHHLVQTTMWHRTTQCHHHHQGRRFSGKQNHDNRVIALCKPPHRHNHHHHRQRHHHRRRYLFQVRREQPVLLTINLQGTIHLRIRYWIT